MHSLDSAWQTVKRAHDIACAQAARAARWETTNDLNQLLRRLRQYQGERDWFSTLVESVTRFNRHVAVFEVVQGGTRLRLRAQSGFTLNHELEIDIASAPAIASAYASKDPVVALRAESEVGVALISPEPAERLHLIPILNGDRVVALLAAADTEYVDINVLELVCGMASLVLERAQNQAKQIQLQTVPGKADAKRELPDWADLAEADRAQHLAAQRFARVTAADWQISNLEACRSGRTEGNLYLHLKREIEAARETYRDRFMKTPSMVDYLHLELVKRTADGDESKLGAEYPGPLV